MWSTIIAASIGGAAAILAAVLGIINHVKIGEVHVLVNNRLDTALEQIADLQKQRDRLQGEEDKKRDDSLYSCSGCYPC